MFASLTTMVMLMINFIFMLMIVINRLYDVFLIILISIIIIRRPRKTVALLLCCLLGNFINSIYAQNPTILHTIISFKAL